MSRRNRSLLAVALFPAFALAVAAGLRGGAESLQPCAETHRPAATYPDYAGAVIPPNIAPLNVKILERGRKFCLRVSGHAGVPIEIFSSDGNMRIRPAAWRKLLEANRGGELLIDIFVKGESGWQRFDTARNRVAAEEIDPYVVYRYIPPIYNKWDRISIRQRDLRSFEERAVFDTQRSAGPDGHDVGGACVNCHTFLNHRTSQMLIHMRPGQGSQIPAMILVRNGRAEKVDTRNGAVPPAAYISWHPSGRLLAYSRNSIMEMFHSAGLETRVVVDRDSSLGLYVVETRQVYTIPQISRPDRLETFPTWSPDGRYLYFCSARLPGTDKKSVPMQYDKMQYDLARIAYDPATGQWGQVEMVVSAAGLGKSTSLPQISPDGRYLMFCAADYGSFPIFQPSSDLYMVDLSRIELPPVHLLPAGTGSAAAEPDSKPLAVGQAAPRRLDEINSERSDSYHTWSSNGSWVLFSSKREDGVFARFYIAHLEVGGRFGKPFVMPQEDPEFYGRCLMTFNRPELLAEPVTVSASELARAINSTAAHVTGDAPRTTATPRPPDEPWQH